MIGDVTKLTIRVRPDGSTMTLKGRVAWAVHCLWQAGESGCTPIDHPGPRWADYTFKAKKAGLRVETVTERHGGSFRGNHARYVLRDQLDVLEIERGV